MAQSKRTRLAYNPCRAFLLIVDIRNAIIFGALELYKDVLVELLRYQFYVFECKVNERPPWSAAARQVF
ncbi:hypothetical protein DICVIV_04446 [Dictyocaulus viviparus]|uniref:Uncharacterized protein n=1 Tax=Dictyocaulus viviparus TaxID=29172 RepID=A0A0D8Y077_DICVI|nr:hypothetical protein DICVIV_04446 [Dictyocaulus viviparus]